MGKLVLVTIGFDVNLVVRSLLKLGLGDGDIVLLVYSKSGGEYEQRRVEEAVKTLKSILSGVRVEHHDVVVTGMDFAKDVDTVLDALKSYERPRIAASLIGGMRIVIITVLAALALYKRFINANAEVHVHVMREDGMYDVLLPFSAFSVPELGLRETKVLRKLGRGLASKPRPEIVSELAREMGVSEYMVYKALESLEKKGAIEARDSIIVLTLLGKLLASAIARSEERGAGR